jgi:hypothetical protein
MGKNPPLLIGYPEIIYSNPENFRIGQIVKNNFWEKLVIIHNY